MYPKCVSVYASIHLRIYTYTNLIMHTFLGLFFSYLSLSPSHFLRHCVCGCEIILFLM